MGDNLSLRGPGTDLPEALEVSMDFVAHPQCLLFLALHI